MQDTCHKETKMIDATTKPIVDGKFWLLEVKGEKLGTLTKEKKGYSFMRKGQKVDLADLAVFKTLFGISITEEQLKKEKTANEVKSKDQDYSIYEFPCSSKPYNPVYDVKQKLPIYSKSDKSKSQYCAGYYVIKFRKGWVKSFCPKLITLERYAHQGPFKTELEMRQVLSTIGKTTA
jgi:hypothetical protein